MIKILLENIYIQSLILGLILLYVYFQLTKRQIKLNEPPLVYYQYPIIGHSLSYITDCEKLILESREKYGETFSLYIFGKIMTIAGKDTVHEVLNKTQDFNSFDGLGEVIPVKEIFPSIIYQKNTDKVVKIVTDLMRSIDNFTSRLQQNIDKTIDIYIGECVEPKVIHNLDDVILNMISMVVANVVVGEDSYHPKDLLETFKNLTLSIAKTILIPKQFAKISSMFVSEHKNVIINHIRPVIKKRFEDKKKLGDAWIAPLDVLQLCLDNPEIAPDLDPNNVNYNVIFDIIGIIIFAATATTSSRAFYAFYELVERKKYWNELCQEAKEISNGHELKPDDLAKMVKLDSFVKESLRLDNDLLTSPHLCISKSHYTFENGYQVPNGRLIFANYRILSSDEETQGQNPREFYAYRHNSPATKVDRNFLVFGSGKHICPGRFLAINVIKIFLHKIMLKYNLKTENGQVISKKHVGGSLNPSKIGIIFENSN